MYQEHMLKDEFYLYIGPFMKPIKKRFKFNINQ